MDRRQFLSTPALALAPAAPAAQRIDCQSHLFCPDLLDLMEKRHDSPRVYRQGADRFVIFGEWKRRVLPKYTDVAARLADMDAAGIGLTALSINDPGPELFGKEGPAVARLVNDWIAGIAKQHPTRFFGLCVLPQDMQACLMELDRCVNRLGMKGILLYSNNAGRFPEEPEFLPLFRRAEELDIPIFLHPAYPITYDATKGYETAAGLGLMFDTTIALTRIILAGILDKHPKLKLVCPHLGGTLPYLVGRIDHRTMVLKRGAERIRRAPREYLRQVWLDMVSPLAMSIRNAFDFVGPDRMLYASDHPWVDPKWIANNVSSLRFSAEEESKIFGGNARRLFRL